MHPALARARSFCRTLGIEVPILLAPMAGACPVALSAAVARGGGMGACGALLMAPEQIAGWAAQMRAVSNGAFQMNLWIPDPPPQRDPDHEAALRHFLGGWGPEVPEDAAEAPLPDFDAQCAAMIAAGPAVISSIMGVYPPEIVAQIKAAAGEHIRAVLPDWKQSNMHALAQEMSEVRETREMTPAETLQHQALLASWAWAKSVRAASDVAEADAALMDRAALDAWTMPSLPEWGA